MLGYSSTDIIQALKSGDISISDFDPKRLGANSYDVILGRYFYEVLWVGDQPWYVGPIMAEDGQFVTVPVGGTLLAMTRDVVGTFGKITAIMKAKSSTGRRGIAVCKCAGLGDIGYHNYWTMEMTGFTRIGTPTVQVGKPIAQLAFYECKSPPIEPYQGQYRIEDWPLCMVPEKDRSRIVSSRSLIPGIQEV